MSYTLDLSGRVALITGASSGLGKQFALTLSKAGAAVVLGGRRIERLKDLRSEIEAGGGDAHVVGVDVTDLASIRSAVAHAETEVGPIDILVNNSGVSTTERLVDVSEESYDYVPMLRYIAPPSPLTSLDRTIASMIAENSAFASTESFSPIRMNSVTHMKRSEVPTTNKPALVSAAT